MKKSILFAAIIVIAITACSKNDEYSVKEHSVLVNVSYKFSKSPEFTPKTANNTTVMIFKDEGKVIDNEETSLLYDKVLTYTDGTKSEESIYKSNSLSGINTFKNTPNGSYIITAVHVPSEFIQYYSIKKITITENDLDIISHDLMFDRDKEPGYQEWKDK